MAEAVKLHVKKGDTVVVLAGKDKGKEGKVTAAFPKKSKVTVEGVNQVKRHTKPSQSNPQGGIITKQAQNMIHFPKCSFCTWELLHCTLEKCLITFLL